MPPLLVGLEWEAAILGANESRNIRISAASTGKLCFKRVYQVTWNKFVFRKGIPSSGPKRQ